MLGFTVGQCLNVIDFIDGQEIICGAACNPSEQMCHFCLTQSHRMYQD